ncbi:glycosyltransferase [Neobacillus vireti]|uniref:glycosyltransferase family protein n=1 Tax=Neobacillus vireti TaxID=220686 RepID=UPI002FFE2829
MKDKLKVLLLIKPFWRNFPKHKPKFETITALENFADVRYWYRDGNIKEILKRLNYKPDFILHYDVAWGYAFAPIISGLDQVDIPKGCIVIDTHYFPYVRRQYFKDTNIDIIFSLTKSPFLKTFPEYQEKFRWWPFSINPGIFKDWQLEKDIDCLLMGQVYDREGTSPNNTKTPKGRYPFREEVLEKMRNTKGFVFHPHPGHDAPSTAILNERYAQELNRSKIFFTCGGVFKYPVLKYFEAPACRTLLLAEPVQDIVDLGFKDGQHFVACDQSNIQEKTAYYLENEQERQFITDNGFEFVHQYHSNQARALQLVDYIEAFIKDRATS